MVHEGHKARRKVMKKICFGVIVLSTILLMVSLSFAQTPRQPTSSDSKSTFGNIAVMGLDSDGSDGYYVTGVPAYIEMTSSAGSVYYLYVGYDGGLRIASDVVIGLGASPTTAGWSDASGVLVGTQHSGRQP